jgi:hypothetical protein
MQNEPKIANHNGSRCDLHFQVVFNSLSPLLMKETTVLCATDVTTVGNDDVLHFVTKRA